MDEDILDHWNEAPQSTRKYWIRIILATAINIFLLWVLDFIRPWVPEHLVKTETTTISTIGALLLLILIIHSIVLPKTLKKANFRELPIALVTGVSFYFSFIVFKCIQVIRNVVQGLNIDLLDTFISSIFFLLFSIMIANIVIHRSRNKPTTIPVLLLLTVVFIFTIIVPNILG